VEYMNSFRFADLPTVTQCSIFSLLEPKEIGRCCEVSRSFKKTAGDDRVWKQLVPRPLNQVKDIKSSLAGRICISVQQVMRQLEQFISQLDLRHGGSFVCRFSANSAHHISVVIKSQINRVESASTLKKEVLLLQSPSKNEEQEVFKHAGSLVKEMLLSQKITIFGVDVRLPFLPKDEMCVRVTYDFVIPGSQEAVAPHIGDLKMFVRRRVQALTGSPMSVFTQEQQAISSVGQGQ